MKTTNQGRREQGGTAIDFVALFRQEKQLRRHRGGGDRTDPSPVAVPLNGDSTTEDHHQDDGDDDGALEAQKNEPRTRDGPASMMIITPPWTGSRISLSTRRGAGIVSCQAPGHIFYGPNILSFKQQQALREWLQQLPTAPPEARPVPGTWHELRHARRRVALFTTLVVDDDDNNNNICPGDNATMGIHPDSNPKNPPPSATFPSPLQELVQDLETLLESRLFWSTSSSSSTSSLSTPVALVPFRINHILINEYTEADQGIMPHTDGPAYAPRTLTLSLGGPVLFNFTPMVSSSIRPDKKAQVLLEPGSLVIFEQDAYAKYRHGIEDRVTVEWADKTCLNAAEGTAVVRQPERISLTFRQAYPAAATTSPTLSSQPSWRT